MSKQLFLTLLLVTALVVAAFLLFNGEEENQVPNVPNNEPDDTAVNTPAPWETYENDEFNFTFSHPEDAQIRVEAGRVKVQVFGPDTIPNSEVTDGFTLFLQIVPKDQDQSLEELAEAKYEEEIEQLDGVSAPSEIQIGDRTAYVYEIRSQLGSVITYHLIEKDETEVYEASVTIADPANRGYAETVTRIESSLEPRTTASSES